MYACVACHYGTIEHPYVRMFGEREAGGYVSTYVQYVPLCCITRHFHAWKLLSKYVVAPLANTEQTLSLTDDKGVTHTMERNTRVCPTLLLLGIVLLLNTPHDVSGTSFLSRPIAIVRHNSVAETRIINESSSSQCILFVRGGSAVEEADEDEEDDEHDVVDEEESDDEVEETVALKTSTVKSAQKSVKSQVAQAMKHSEPIKISRRKRKSILAVLKIPYILRACLNPFTFMAMTKAYFSSLFNINYLEEVSLALIELVAR